MLPWATMDTKQGTQPPTGGDPRWWLQPSPSGDRQVPHRSAPHQGQDLSGSSVGGAVFLGVLAALLVVALVVWFIGSHFGVIVVQ